MKENRSSNNGKLRSGIFISVFVVSIIVIGVSVSYAFYTANMTGNATVPNSNAAVMNVITNLEEAGAINAAKLSLIDAADYLTKAQKVEFSVTNETTSNVKAKYIVKLVEMSLSKNLSSKYFKWLLVVNAGTSSEKTFSGNFFDTAIATEGTTDKTVVSDLTKTLITDENALTLNIGATDNIDFYIWLENDLVDQIYLTNGNFTGKLSIEAVPTK